MNEAKQELSEAINKAKFNEPICPIYQNVSGVAETSLIRIKENLISQLTSPVRWTHTINQMIEDGASEFIDNSLQAYRELKNHDKCKDLDSHGVELKLFLNRNHGNSNNTRSFMVVADRGCGMNEKKLKDLQEIIQ